VGVELVGRFRPSGGGQVGEGGAVGVGGIVGGGGDDVEAQEGADIDE